MLNPRQHQGLYGETFIRALASAAGLIVARADLDVTGEDFTISHKGVVAGRRHPKIDVQIKSWSNPDGTDADWAYPLRVEHFNELAGADYSLPRFLIVVVVPRHAGHYAVAQPNQLALRHGAYWVSLRDEARVDPATRSRVVVRVPKANLVTTDVLRSLVTTPLPAEAAS